jgi:hypothetical protein
MHFVHAGKSLMRRGWGYDILLFRVTMPLHPEAMRDVYHRRAD